MTEVAVRAAPRIQLDISCKDWVDRLKTGRVLVPDLNLPWASEGARAVAIFNRLRLADVVGTPTLEDACGEWFRAIVRTLFGALDPVTRIRLIRELFVLVPKKNGKTSLGALLMLTELLMNQRPHATFIMTAPVKDVADVAFEAAAGAIALDPVLSKKLHVIHHQRTIIHRELKAALQIMTFDPSVLTGQKVAGALIDELHVVAKLAHAPSAMRQLRGGMLPFPEAFMAFITTQSEQAPTGIFKAELNKARSIRDGTATGSMLPVLYEFPREMQKDRTAWRDPQHWHMVTPSLNRPITLDRLVEEMAEAEAKGADELIAWASQHLNVEIGLALHTDRWAGADFWLEQGDTSITLDWMLEHCEVICVGIDGGGLDDLLGFAAGGRLRDSRDWVVWTRAWAHPSVLERRKSEAERFKDFAADGDLVLVDKIGDDVTEVGDLVERIHTAGLLDKVGVDPVGIAAIIDELEARGITREDGKIVGISQGWKLAGAIKTAERRLAEGTLAHSDQPMMAWCVGNAKVEPRGNAITITKQAAGYAKIDPLMATFNAIDLLSRNPEPPQTEYRLSFA
jgi:phage terminase large subunit-like protein